MYETIRLELELQWRLWGIEDARNKDYLQRKVAGTERGKPERKPGSKAARGRLSPSELTSCYHTLNIELQDLMSSLLGFDLILV